MAQIFTLATCLTNLIFHLMKTKKLLITAFIALTAVGSSSAQNKADNLDRLRGELSEVNTAVADLRGGACNTWVDPSPTTGWTDFAGQFGGAPCNSGSGCPFNEITDIEVWKSEAYSLPNVVAGSSYTFSHCNGPGAGSWVPDYTIIAPGGAIDASGAGDGDGCSITWTASVSGTYLIVINEAGSCGVAGSVDNGFPAITCSGAVPCPAACEAGTLNVATTQCVEFGAQTAEFGVDPALIEIPTGGAYGLQFQPVTGQGTGASAPDGFIVTFNTLPTFPLLFDSDFNGLLSSNSLTPFAGQWLVAGTVLTTAADLNSGCDLTEIITITFSAEGVACPVSVNTLDPSSFSIYPNPNSGQFTVSVSGLQGDATVQVMDLTGKVLRTGMLPLGTESRMDIDLGNHASGLYLVRFTVEGASHVSKVSVN